MKIAMIFPSRESEKAIASYSIYLTKALEKNQIDIDTLIYKAGSPKSFFRIIPKLKKYDIIHIQHEYNLLGYYGLPFFFVYVFLGLIKRKRIITTMHTVLSQKEKFRENPLKTFFRKLLYLYQNKLINLISDYIIVHAHFFKDILEKEYKVPTNKIRIIPQGIIEDIKITPKNKAKKILNIFGRVYLIIGNFVPDHGADIILKQAKRIGKKILVVASPKAINDRNQKRLTDYINYCIYYVKKNNLEKYIRFDIKPISDKMPKWWLYFSAADLILQPYKGGIGSGIFTHAMAAKKPVIASNISFFKEISKKYGCVKIAEKEKDYPRVIKEAMKPKNYSKMKKECEKYLAENNWPKISNKYKSLYNSLILL